MASIIVSGDTSGAVTLAAPAVAGSTTLTLPTTTGTLVVTGGAQTIEFADGTVSAPSITNSGDTNTGIYFPAADTIAFTEGGVESMRITSTGKVGIGTTPAAWDTSANSTVLQVYSSSFFDFLGAQLDVGLNTYYDGSNYRRIGTAEATRYSQSGGAHFWSTAASGSAGSTITWTEQMRINANSPVLCLAGGSTAAGGTGIAFPATQNASSNANTLDDYEEGTWTPTLVGNSTAGTYTFSASHANYTKIGRQVTVNAYLIFGTASGGSGVAKFGGLPFSKANNVLTAGNLIASGLDFGAGTISLAIGSWTLGPSTEFYISESKDNASEVSMDIAGISTGDYVTLSMTYFT